ncbi:hypothetical protein SLS56_011417 [Neofusicoccum ribis]|uniref:Ankyrin n=1 Tax=Neofusicoccum ribis TaxID=45134 RepID=A0ABR3SBR5_9PEZI
MSDFSYQLLRTAIRQYPKDRTLRLIRKAPQHVIKGSTKDGRQSPLHAACQVLDSDIVEALLEKGADTSLRTADGKTPLHCALAPLDLPKNVYKASRLSVVTSLLSTGADASAVDEDRNTALHLAILHGYIDCARLLLAYDDSPLTIPNKRGEIPLFVSAADQFSAAAPMDMAAFLTRWHILNRPLHRAVATGDVQRVQDVLDSGEEISARNMLGDAGIHLAAMRGDVKMVRFLLHRGASAGQKGYLGQTALHRAAAVCVQPNDKHGIDAPVQKSWTESEIELFHSVSEYRQAATSRSRPSPVPISSQYLKVAELFMDTGLRPSLPDALLRSPLHLAAAAGNEAFVYLLLAHGADPNAPDLHLKTPLCHAAASGNVDLMMVLLQNNASLHLQSEHFQDVGHLAVQCGWRCVSANMLSSSDEQGRTPLIHAVQNGELASVDYLLQAGAYVDQIGKGWSPLVQACDKRHWEVAKLLLDRGADFKEYEHELRTTHSVALHLAAKGGSSDTIRHILHKEAKAEEQADQMIESSPRHSRRSSVQSFRSVSSFRSMVKVTRPTDLRIGFFKWTPLHYAASMGHKDAVATLLGYMERMEIIARDIDGLTAQELAKGGGYEEIVQRIEERLS